ncbi:hypothetical protein ABZ802_17380 [Streptomyces sp. NPDC047737]|uniref:hypothetical protein n=1 Tax=Streptomyces sp. NPDC047737 TaxID=3155740 RepID=UPI0033F2F04D
MGDLSPGFHGRTHRFEGRLPPGRYPVALRLVEQPGHLWLQMGGGAGAFRFARL